MRVLFDYQIFIEQRFGGISRYFYELGKRMERTPGVDLDIPVVGNRNHYLGEYLGKPERTGEMDAKRVTALRRINQINTALRMRTRRYDIIHPTYYSKYLANNRRGKVVVTFYDMIQEVFPEADFGGLSESKRVVAQSADHIIAISESTKRDILRFYPDIDEDKISVIYISSDMQKSDDTSPRDRYGDYLLFVGRRDGYKNFELFFQALRPLLVDHPGLSLVCAGGGPFSAGERARFAGLEGRVHQLACDDAQLAALYSNALCFVFPSKYEGFGIPTLEAFACDCPVVLANTSSMPEVGGDAVAYCDPNDVDSIRSALERVVLSESLRNDLVEKGRVQRLKFDWDDIAAQTLACYRKVLGEDGARR